VARITASVGSPATISEPGASPKTSKPSRSSSRTPRPSSYGNSRYGIQRTADAAGDTCASVSALDSWIDVVVTRLYVVAYSAVAMASSIRQRSPQVNIRLDASDADVLAAVAFLNDCSATEVLRPLIASYLAEQRKDPEVQAAIRAKERRQVGL
jgi:hypothetical protein